MTSTLVATFVVSLRRMRAAWPIVLAAGVTCLLAASLLAAGPIYAEAVSIAGLHRVLDDAPVGEADVQVSLRVDPAQAADVDAVVTEALGAALAGVDGPILRSARSTSFELPGSRSAALTDLVEFGYAERLADHASLVAGSWPTDDEGGSVPVAISTTVADQLDLAVGDELRLVSRLDPAFVTPVRIAAVFAIDDHDEAYWWGEPQVLDGLLTSDDYATHGPFFTTRRAVLERATVSRVQLTWRGFPTTSALTVDAMAALRERVAGLDGVTETDVGGIPVTVVTAIPDILSRAERSLLVSRTGVILLVVQLAVLAGYAVLLSAALLVEHRRIDTAMLRSRGAGPIRIGALTLVEGVLVVIPAALLGPWVALAALQAFNVTGPLADIGLHIQPAVSWEAYLAAGVAALGCLIALVVPALPTRRSFTSVQRGIDRASRITPGQRLGLDIALVALALIGLWQLRHYGAPLTRSVQGTIGIDPLLIATPAIGLLAGAVVALRVLPMLARVAERATSRGRGLVTSLGARQLARRPLRYTRAALLLILAMSMGVFAVSYTQTWATSQRDQAAFQVGTQIRVEPGIRSTAQPRWSLDQAYAALPRIVARMPVDRAPIQATRSDGGSLLAVDAVAAPAVVVIRPDLTDAPMSALMAPLVAARPAIELVPLTTDPDRLRLAVDPGIRAMEGIVVDDATGARMSVPVDPTELDDRGGIGASVVIRDATGLIHRFRGEAATLGGGPQELVVPLRGPDDAGLVFAEPLDVLAIELDVTPPAGTRITAASMSVLELAVATSDGPWWRVPLDLAGGWRLTTAVAGQPHQAADGSFDRDGLTAPVGGIGLPRIEGVDRYGRGTVLTFAPQALEAAADAPLEAIATDRFLELASRSVGDSIMVEISGVRRAVRLAGRVDAFPTADPGVPTLVVDLPTLVLLRYEGSDAVDPAGEWWFDVAEADVAGTAAVLDAAPIDSRAVQTLVGRERALATDPVALGVIGALAIGFVAAALFAVVGFVVSAAVSARERVGEFALLRALGLSSGQLSSWLSLENALLAVVSLVVGTALGLVIAWVVLPFVTVTQDARVPFPAVVVQTPWSLIIGLVVLALVALLATIIVLGWLLRRIGLAAVLRTGED